MKENEILYSENLYFLLLYYIISQGKWVIFPLLYLSVRYHDELKVSTERFYIEDMCGPDQITIIIISAYPLVDGPPAPARIPPSLRANSF